MHTEAKREPKRLTLLHVLAARLVLGGPLSQWALTPLLSAWRSARNGAASPDHSSCMAKRQ